MLKRNMVLKAAIVCAAVVGMAQANQIQANSSEFWQVVDFQGNMQWQDIKSVTASFNDLNNDGILETGEGVTFTVTMEKTDWGTHNYDALQTWLDNAPWISAPYLDNEQFTWDYNSTLPAGITSYTDPRLTNMAWTGGTMAYKVSYTFSQAGQYDFGASVMCSRDLSNLANPTNPASDNPDAADWAAWSPIAHYNNSGLQGEDEIWRLQVAQNVPEPGSLSLMLLGLSGLAGSLFIRRKNK